MLQVTFVRSLQAGIIDPQGGTRAVQNAASFCLVLTPNASLLTSKNRDICAIPILVWVELLIPKIQR
jgi:hypothetical protein